MAVDTKNHDCLLPCSGGILDIVKANKKSLNKDEQIIYRVQPPRCISSSQMHSNAPFQTPAPGLTLPSCLPSTFTLPSYCKPNCTRGLVPYSAPLSEQDPWTKITIKTEYMRSKVIKRHGHRVICMSNISVQKGGNLKSTKSWKGDKKAQGQAAWCRTWVCAKQGKYTRKGLTTTFVFASVIPSKNWQTNANRKFSKGHPETVTKPVKWSPLDKSIIAKND